MGLWMIFPLVIRVYETCGITVSRDAESIGDTPNTLGNLYMPRPETPLLLRRDEQPSVASTPPLASYLFKVPKVEGQLIPNNQIKTTAKSG